MTLPKVECSSCGAPLRWDSPPESQEEVICPDIFGEGFCWRCWYQMEARYDEWEDDAEHDDEWEDSDAAQEYRLWLVDEFGGEAGSE